MSTWTPSRMRSRLKPSGSSSESATIDEWAEGTTFAIPFFIFQGERDVITPPEPVQWFFNDVTAPVKDFALIQDASHFASFRRPDQFLDLMLISQPII